MQADGHSVQSVVRPPPTAFGGITLLECQIGNGIVGTYPLVLDVPCVADRRL